MPDNQNPGTINSQPNVLKQSFATLQTVVNYGADAVNGEETENKFALQKDLNSLTKKANDLQGELSTLKGSGTGSVQSQISSALDKYAEITPKGNVYTISIGSGKSKASFVSPSVYEGSGDIAALAYGRNVKVNADGAFASGSFSVVKPTNANQMLVSTAGGQGLEFRAIPKVTTGISEEDGKALVDINVATSGDSTTISGVHKPFVNKVTTSGTGNVVDGASVSNNVLTLKKDTTAIVSVAGSQTGESSNSQSGDVAIKSISKNGSELSYATTQVVTPSHLSKQLSEYWRTFDADTAAGSNGLKDYIDNADSGLEGRIDSLEDAVGSGDAGGSLTSRVGALETKYNTLTGGDATAKLSDYMKKDAITFDVSGGTLTITVKE